MHFFKSIDFWVQAGLILLTGAAFIMDDVSVLNPGATILAFAVWQILSLLVNVVAGPQPWKMKNWRKYHLLGIGIVVLLIIVAALQSDASRTGDKDDKYSMAGLGTAIFALIPAILISLFYVLITYKEWQRIKK
ncbi:MAG: hypothetical protein NTW29_10315 [Bacteroidetes bacterium]|nr:hypothetical protein [Bacteroidota bacterium]